jgi:uncharacterized protein (DUF302 family)
MFRPNTRDDVEGYDRLAEVKAKGATVFARTDDAAGALAVGLSLRSTEIQIFGNAKGFTPLMQSMQTIGIHLPASKGGGK